MWYGPTYNFQYDISIVIKWGTEICCFIHNFNECHLWLLNIVRTVHLVFLCSGFDVLIFMLVGSFATSWHVSDVCGPQLSFRTAGFVACHFKWGIFVFSQVQYY